MAETDTVSTKQIQDLPLIVLEQTVVFPYTVVRLALEKNMMPAVEASLNHDNLVLLVPRREDADPAAPLSLQLHRVGVIARIEQAGTLPSGENVIAVRGIVRAILQEERQTEPYMRFAYIERPDSPVHTPEIEVLMNETRAAIDAVLELRGNVPQEVRNFVRSIDDPGHLADNTGYSPDYTFAERQDLLETFDLAERLRKVRDFYKQRLALLEVQTKLRQDVQDGAAKQQREFFLRQQLKAIQEELGETDNVEELDDLRQKLAALDLPEEARNEVDRELKRLNRINEASPEYQTIRTYLEWIAELPWNNPTGTEINIAHAREVLDADHAGLEKVKERLLEHLAVKRRRNLRAQARAAQGENQEDTETQINPIRYREPILALVGPPGVGKTSLGQSVARALGRKFIRMSLGGVRDEAELRGFRRTYIGSAPGRIIQEMRRAGTSDPVIMLDEIDKLGMDYRGDPSAALLEILDPEQNNTFTDHYLNLPYDLSKVLFIATANSLETIPPALRDRLEIIQLSGYTEDEKVQIAQQHLLQRQFIANGLESDEVNVTEDALRAIISDYTRESGVRNLEREIGSVLRKVARQIDEAAGQNAESAQTPFEVSHEFVRESLGRPRFYNEAKERIDQPGISTGLVWTPVGGDILFVEASSVPGTKELKVTGQLGDVMRESAEAALSYIRTHSNELGIAPSFFDEYGIHVHVPAGAVPKDGPSAGITMATALASVASGRVVRDDVAMTGELTLRGRVLPIGGLKEKVLGAHRAGIQTIILPRRNEGDLEDLPQEVRNEMRFVPVDTLDEVFRVALEDAEPATWETPRLNNVLDKDVKPMYYPG